MKKYYTVNAKADGMVIGELDTDGTLESCIDYVKRTEMSNEDVEICEWTCDGDEICTDVITEW